MFWGDGKSTNVKTPNIAQINILQAKISFIGANELVSMCKMINLFFVFALLVGRTIQK